MRVSQKLGLSFLTLAKSQQPSLELGLQAFLGTFVFCVGAGTLIYSVVENAGVLTINVWPAFLICICADGTLGLVGHN